MPELNTQNPASHVRTHLIVLALFLLLAIAMTYPLITQMATHVPGDGRDDPPLVWNLWWVRHALLDLHTNPLVSGYMFFPIGINLTFFTLTILNGLLSIPLQLAAGLVVSSNANLLASYTVGGFGMYLLALDILQASRPPGRRQDAIPYLAAFVAGLVFAFAPIKMIFASLGQFNMASTQWMPFCILYILRATRPVPESAGMPSLTRTSPGSPKSEMPPVVESPEAPRLRRRLVGLWLRVFPPSDRTGRHDALKAAVFLLFTAYAEFTFASFLLIFLAFYVIYLLATRRAVLLRGFMAGRLLVFGLTVMLIFWPILASMLREMAVEGDYSLTAGWGFADSYSADVLGFFVPSSAHPVFGDAAVQATSDFTYTNFATIGWVVLLLALAGLVLHRRGRQHPTAPTSFWGLSALLYSVLSLGPVLHINGQWVFNLDGLLVRVPLPFIILHYIPFIKANRYPSRLQVLVVLCLAVLVAYGVFEIANRTRMYAERARSRADRDKDGSLSADQRSFRANPRSIAVPLLSIVLCGAILVEFVAAPLPMSDMRTPAVYKQIAQDNGAAPVLQLPISWRNSFQFIPQTFTALPQAVNTVSMFEQFYQATHGGPILSGNTSRNPEFKFTYFLEAPVIRSLVALEEGRTLTPEQIAYDRSIAPDVLRFLGFKYIVLHPPLVGGPVEDYVRAVFPVEPIAADNSLSAYHVVTAAPAGTVAIDMGSDLSNLYRAEGWGEPQATPVMGDGRVYRWTDRKDARLMIPLAAPAALSISVDLYLTHDGRNVSTVVNGHALPASSGAPSSLAVGWTTIHAEIPAEWTRIGLNDLVIAVHPLGPLPYEPSTPFEIGQTGVKTNTNVVVYSAGLDAGGDLGFAHVYVNGKDAITGRRGFNVAVIDPATGKVERTANFDLLAGVEANTRLLDFMKAVPEGRAVAAAVMDDASINFGDGAAAALRMIGAQSDLRGRLRNSYAALGVKGAAPGTAAEEWAQGRPASVAAGAHVFGKGLGVAVSGVVVEAK